MQIYFGEVPEEYVEEFGDSGFIVEGITGQYYYMVEMVYTDSFKLVDTVGRYVPISYDHLDQLIFALTTLKDKTQCHINSIEKATNELKEMHVVVS